MPLITKNKTVYAKLQAARGAAIAVAAGDAVLVHNPSVDPVHAIRTVDRDDSIGGFGQVAPVYGGSLMSVTMSWRVLPGADNHHKVLWQMCGFAETAASDPSNSNNPFLEMQPSSTADKYGTIVIDTDGKRRTLHDCVGTSLSCEMTAGGAIEFTATFVGYGVETDHNYTAETYPTDLPFVCRGATLTLDGTSSFVHKSMSIDFGLSAPDRDDMSEASSFAAPLVVNMDPTGSVTIEDVLVATKDVQALVTGDPVALSVSVPAGTHAFSFTIAKAKFTGRSDGDDSGVMTQEMPFRIARDGGVLSVKMKIAE